ncbi:MAG: formylglycine-generating enzyme family protein [Planctomycetes bacterium]|nr:formylglycine-generating enzyme family protein [Planctomycetota bacterium]
MMRFWSVGVIALGWMASEGSGRDVATKKQDPPEMKSLDLGGGVKMEFVRIVAGTFNMGSDIGREDEKPVHQVTISKDFWMQSKETTQAQWKALMGGENPSQFKGDDLPVERVSWEECQTFLAKLMEKTEEQLKGLKPALPTEAEWEYACRAGSTTKWYFGDDPATLGDHAWHRSNADMKTHPVGQKTPNEWGLYDMHGNVWEWCNGWYDIYPAKAETDPKGPTSGNGQCLRGGGWNSEVDYTSSSIRDRYAPTSRRYYIGFRVALR